MAVKVGVGYLAIQPSLTPSEFSAQLSAKLNDTMTRAGRQAGEAAGKQLGEGMAAEAPKKAPTITTKVRDEVVPKARKTGEEAGTKLGEGMAERARSGIGKLTGIIGLSLGGLGVGEIVKSSLEAASAANKAQRLTEAVVKSTGEAAHVSAQDVGELSEKLAGMTGIQAAQIQHAQNLLLTFTGIKNSAGAGNDVFNQATKAALNMSVALGEDSASAAIQLGKALNDPVKGVTALRRVGVQLTQQQQDQVAALVKSGDTMGAQKIILGELQTEFGGAAEAGSTGMGRLSAVVEILKEKLGNLLIPAVKQLVVFLTTYGVPAVEALINGFKGVASGGDGPAKAFNQIGQFVRSLVLDAKALLPVVMSVLKALWPFRGLILGVVGAFILWNKAVAAITATQKALATAQKLFAVGEKAGGSLASGWIGLIIVGVVALVAGLIYAYKHFKGFRDFVNAVWRDIKIGVDWLWHQALEPALRWVANVGFPAVQKAAVWLWRNVLEPAFKGIGIAAQWLWGTVLKPVLLDFIVPAFRLLWTGIKLYVGFIGAMLRVEFAVVMWVWQHILKPVLLDFIVPAFKLLWAGVKLYVGFIAAVLRTEFAVALWVWHNVISPFVAGVVAGVKLLWAGVKLYVGLWVAVFRGVAAVATWLWKSVLAPVFAGIGAVLRGVWDYVIWPIWKLWLLQWRVIGAGAMWLWHNAIQPALAGVAAVFTWLWHAVVEPAIAGVAAVFTWLYDHAVKPVVALVVAAFHDWQVGMLWLWHNVVEPIIAGVAAVFTWLWEHGVKPVIGFLVDGFHGFEALLSWLWHQVFEPAIHGVGAVVTWLWDKAISPALDAIKGGFHTAVDAISTVWDGLKKAAMEPVKFVVNTVYNDGIKKAWNWLADLAGFKKLPDFTISGYQRGGVVAGSGNGDIVPALLEPGERVLSRDQVATLGGHAALDAAVGRGGGQDGRYADGGIISKVPGFSALLGLINSIPGKGGVHDMLTGLLTNGLTSAAQFVIGHVPGLGSLIGAASGVASGAKHLWNKLFDAGGWLTPGTHVVANMTGRPEAVLRPAAVDQLGGPGAVNALNAGRAAFGDVHVTVNNPVPEPASETVPAAMRRLAYQLAG